jgi:signal transduction histidine kinase
MLNSLKFQISAALLLLLILFSGAIGYTFLALEHQRNNDAILTLAGRLQLTAQYLSNQAMRYKQHAPRDYDSYFRDLELYYKDLLGHVETFDMISAAFMHRDFQPMVTGLVDTLHPKLGPEVVDAIADLEKNWMRYRRELFEALNPESGEPRLEWGAEYVLAHNDNLEAAANQLTASLKTWSTEDLKRIRQINRTVVLAGIGVAIAVIVWLFLKVLIPLNGTLKGFRQVSQGEFGIQVVEEGGLEAVQLTRAFNHLSSRLKILFDLIERLQEGSDLDQTLAFLSREFQGLLRIDWIGILFVTGDGGAAKLEAAYLDGEREIAGKQIYSLKNTLLERALSQGRPFHIPDMERTGAKNPTYVFLRSLTTKGMRDAIFLPLTEESQSPVPGVLVFAARSEYSYDKTHLDFLNNIAQLVTHSFGRTVKLAEHSRLAAIGEFASGIAHELRSPLATVSMALDHFNQLELPANSAKRAELAAREATRMGHLLDEMLLYAKPLKMRMEPLDPAELLREFAESHQDLAAARDQRIQVRESPRGVRIIGDSDRLTQVMLNLTRNACEAAPEGSTVSWSLSDHPGSGTVELTVHNSGDPIAPDVLPRLTQPFFTTKQAGTGLGLAIVRRMADAHGGDLKICSEYGQGTRVIVSLPRIGD